MSRRATIFGISVLVLALSGSLQPAYAVNYNVTFCFKAQINFLDASGGDFWTSNNDQVVRGVRVRVREGLLGATVYYNYTSAETGCTPALSLSSTKNYSIIMYSEATVYNSNKVEVVDDHTTPAIYFQVVDTGFVPAASTTVYYAATDAGDEHIAQVTAAAAYSIDKRYGGLSSQTFTIFNENSACGSGGSCARVDGVYLSENGKTKKFILSHELGHSVGIKRDENRLVSINELNNDSHVCDEYPPDADPPISGHDFLSIEWQNTGAKEGFGHFYAATIWNAIGETDCEFYYYKGVDYDKDGDTDGPIYSCETDANYLEDECGPTFTNRSIEIDWLRFWWDLLTDEGETFGNIADVWDGADPGDWENDGVGVYDSLWDSADAEGVNMSSWDTWAGYNGTDH